MKSFSVFISAGEIKELLFWRAALGGIASLSPATIP